MSEREAELLRRLRSAFREEARDHLQAISAGLSTLASSRAEPERRQAVESVFRRTHSLKGAARAARFADIERICQQLEELFALCKRSARVLSGSELDTLQRAFDLVGARLEASEAAPEGAISHEVSATVERVRAMLAGEGRGAGVPVNVEDPVDAGRTGEQAAPLRRSGPVPAQPARLDGPRAESVRVASRQLDRLVLAVEELLPLKQAAAERADELAYLAGHFEAWDKQWLAVQASLRQLRTATRGSDADTHGHRRPEANSEAGEALLRFLDWNFAQLKSIEGRLRPLAKLAAQERHAVARQVEELLAESKDLLMLPFSTLSELLARPARELAREQGKPLELELAGGEVRLDKRVLEQLKDPLLHLVRNAIDHGIETPARRAELGKPSRARLRIAAGLVQGNKVEVVVADDGSGIDPQRLRESAVLSGVLDRAAGAALGDEEAIGLVFRSEVSTSLNVTGISGRGLGLPIAREQVEKLDGSIAIETRAPAGAVFRITVPQSLAVLRGILVETAQQGFVIPTLHVERVVRIDCRELKTVENRETVTVDGRPVSLARLAEVLELGARREPGEDRFLDAVVVGHGGDRVAFAVDQVLHDEEVLARPFTRPLVRVRNVAGATVLPSGKVWPILNVADLLKSARRLAAAPRPARSEGAVSARPPLATRVLLAEDSITSRLLLKGILEGEGCEVRTAVDGIDAFTALRSERFDLLVSDVEMPRLDGFDLTARVRADPVLAELPVILVTARATREDRERGIDVGANAYLAKGSFDQRELVAAVRRLAGTRQLP